MKRLLLLSGLLGLTCTAAAAPTVGEIYYYNHPDFADWGLFLESENRLVLHELAPGPGGTTLVTGLFTSVDFAEADPYDLPDDWFVTSRLYSVSATGSLNWSREYHSSTHAFLGIRDVLATPTGAIATGSFRQPDLHYDLWALRTDPAGLGAAEYFLDLGLPEPVAPQEWMNVIHGTHLVPTATPDEYVIAGWYSVNAAPNSGFLFAFNASTGAEVWRQGFTETGSTWALPLIHHCEALDDGGFLLATASGVHRADADGAPVWAHDYARRYLKALPYGSGFAALTDDNHLVILDSEGIPQDDFTLQSEEKAIELVDFAVLSDGFVFCGNAEWLIYEDSDVLLFRTDAEGNELYSYPVGTRNDEEADNLRLTDARDAAIVSARVTCADGETYPWILQIPLDHNRPVAAVEVADPTTYTPFVEEPVVLDAGASFDPDGEIRWYYWDFGDGTQLDSPVADRVTHAFQRTGDLQVTVRVRNNEGIETTANTTVTVLPWAEQWSRDLGSGDGRYIERVVQTAEGFAAAGWYGNSPRIVKFLRLDARGVSIPGSVRGFVNPVQSSQNTFALDLATTTDGGFILPCVNQTTTGTSDYSLRLLKLDAAGDREWDRIFGTNAWEYGTRAHPLADGSGYIVTGWHATTYDDDSTRNGLWFLHLDSDATTILEERTDYYTDLSYTYGVKSNTAIACRDGSGYILDVDSGSVRAPFEFIKIDVSGEEVWRAAFDHEGNNHNLIICLAETSDGGVLVGGEGRRGSFLARFSETEAGTMENDWVLDPLTEGWWWSGVDRIVALPDGGCFAIVRGEVASLVHRFEICRLNAEGEILWSHTYDENGFVSESPGDSLLVAEQKLVVSSTYKNGAGSTKRLFQLAPNHPPVAVLSLPGDPLYAGIPYVFDASASSDPDGPRSALRFLWEIPGQSPFTTEAPFTPAVTLAYGGTQTIRVTVIDEDGGEDMAMATAPVLAAPSGHPVQFFPSPGGTLVGETLQFVADGAATTPVEAIAADGYYFGYWGGDLLRSENPLTISPVTRALSLTARFIEIPDRWFTDFGLVPGAETVLADSDGDGFRNVEEFLAGTNPSDPEDHFWIEEQATPEGTLLITCPSAPGRIYTLAYAADFATGPWRVHSVQEGTGDLLSFDCSDLEGSRWFFRIMITVP